MTNVIAMVSFLTAKAEEISLEEIEAKPPDDQLDIILRRLLESRLYDRAVLQQRIEGKLSTTMNQAELQRAWDDINREVSRIKRSILGAGDR